MTGAVFAPFHYGTWYAAALTTEGPGRQANELTMTVWDPVSKQPYFKTAACRVTKTRDGDGPSPAPTTTASAPAVPHTTQAPPPPGGATSSEVLAHTPHYALDPSTRRT